MNSIGWNEKVKLILADVDETVADLYIPATEEMIAELNAVLARGTAIFFITGHGLEGVRRRITDRLKAELRSKVLIAHCSGVEVWGFEQNGDLKKQPFYSLYEIKLTDGQKKTWRKVTDQLVSEFKLKTFPASSIEIFKKLAGNDPLAVMMEDRGPQITLEVINGYDLSPEETKKIAVRVPLTHGHYDLRIPILERAEELFKQAGLPITPRLGGVFALDLAVEGVSKTTSVKHVLSDEKIIRGLGINPEDLKNPEAIEIWGDKFSIIRGGSDRHMCEAVDPKVRAIDFREENPEEFMPGYNIVVWDGTKHLHEGLLEYLQTRF